MNLLGRDIRFRRKPGAQVSRIACVLPRIRAIRGECDWQPLTNAAAAKQRRARVRSVRRGIVYHPVSYDRTREFRLPLRRASWLWLGCAIWLCAVALAWIWVAPAPKGSTSRGFSYQLPGAPPFLSEQLALNKAMDSLTQIVSDSLSWQAIENRDKRGSFAPDGMRDVYLSRFDRGKNANQGFLVFQNHIKTNGIWTVSVQLFQNRVDCEVSFAGR
jgi:hypothetical protein